MSARAADCSQPGDLGLAALLRVVASYHGQPDLRDEIAQVAKPSAAFDLATARISRRRPQPRQVRRASKHGVDHGSQIWPWHYLVKLQQGGLLAGRYQHGNTQLYVSRGCGYWGPPVRLLAPL